MTIEEALVAYIKADAGVVALQGSRFFPEYLSKDGGNAGLYPASTFTRISTTPWRCRDDQSLHRCRMQIDCYAQRYTEAQALADAMYTAVIAFRQSSNPRVTDTSLITRGDLYDSEAKLRRVPLDFYIWFDQA